MELNPSRPRTDSTQLKGDISAQDLKKFYKEFSSFGGGERQVMLINDPKGMMDRFKFGIGEFNRFVRVFNKRAMETDIPIFIKFERKNGKYYLCSTKEGSSGLF